MNTDTADYAAVVGLMATDSHAQTRSDAQIATDLDADVEPTHLSTLLPRTRVPVPRQALSGVTTQHSSLAVSDDTVASNKKLRHDPAQNRDTIVADTQQDTAEKNNEPAPQPRRRKRSRVSESSLTETSPLPVMPLPPISRTLPDSFVAAHGFRKRCATAPDGTTVEAQVMCLDMVAELRLRTSDGLLYYARRFDRAWCERWVGVPDDNRTDPLDVAYLCVPPWWDPPVASYVPAGCLAATVATTAGVRLDRQHLVVHVASRGIMRIDDESLDMQVVAYRDARSSPRASSRPRPERTPWQRAVPDKSLMLYRFRASSAAFSDRGSPILGGSTARVLLDNPQAQAAGAAAGPASAIALPRIVLTAKNADQCERLAVRDWGIWPSQLEEANVGTGLARAALYRLSLASSRLFAALDTVGMLSTVQHHAYGADSCLVQDDDSEHSSYEDKNADDDDDDDYDDLSNFIADDNEEEESDYDYDAERARRPRR